MAGIEHAVHTINGRAKSPTGKAPYIEENGKILTDSGIIINYLEQSRGHPVDGRLTLAQRAESLALQRLMEEHFYWVAVYMRWLDPNSRSATRRYAKELTGIPGWLLPFLAPQMERAIARTLKEQGIGRHPPDVIWRQGASDIQALSHWLGNRQWGVGETPTIVDACLYSFVGAIVRTPWESPLKSAALKHSNLISHFDRMMSRYFPES